MVFLSSILTLGLAVAHLSSSSATDENTRNMYAIRSPGTHRKAVEIIDLGTFLLTNSDDGRPKPMTPFLLNIFETRKELSGEALRNVEYAASDFLQMELNGMFGSHEIAEVRTKIQEQERVIEQIEDSTMPQQQRNGGALRRILRAVPGSKFLVHVNVTFDREPSPDAMTVDNSLQEVMKDLGTLVGNITASEDPELGYVFMAYREEISTNQEDPAVSIEKPVSNDKSSPSSMTYLIPIVVAFILFGAIIAMFVIKRRRRRVEASNQKVQEDLAFLDEESNVFSFENSPTKSSARKLTDRSPYETQNDGDESSRYSASQGSMSQSPSFGVSSPTKSYLSGASTVKVSNARLMPLPSKLTELASTSLFAFSEEDEYLDSENEAASSRAGTPVSVQKSEASTGSSLDRIMNGKSEEERSSVEGSPRHAASNKSVFSTIFSSQFFSGGADNASQFAGSQMTAPADNTTEAVRKRAAKKGMRSFSLSPRRKKAKTPTSTRSRAKSDAGGKDDEEDDSVFDFLHSSPVKQANDTSTPRSVDIKSLNEALSQADEVVASTSQAVDSPEVGNKSINASMMTTGARSTRSTSKSPKREVDQMSEVFSDEYDSLSDDDDIHGSFPRRSRRHAKSTTLDGTFAYQTNAMQPQDWSMTDGLSDDETLSEHGGNSGSFPKSPEKKAEAKSPMSASHSAATQNSQTSKTDNASQASASRQLINDLVWLSKKIAGVKQSSVDTAPGEATHVATLGGPPPIEPVDSLSYTSGDGLISPSSTNGDAPNSATKQRGVSQPQTPSNTIAAAAGAAANGSTSIVCRDCVAPPGKLGIVIHSTKDGPAVHEVKEGSCLEGNVFPGDLIISVDDLDTRAFTAAQLMKMMAEKSEMRRKITVLHFEEAEQENNDS